jgi:glycine cleavage system T protein (aminomethyltransferase)
MRRTPLYDAHRALGARMTEFGGWEMPVQYGGIIEEHLAVRARAGLFDVSHMGQIEVRGPGALEACQRLTSNDVARLADGQAQYSLLLSPSGGVIDDVVLHRLAADRFLFCVNAANAGRDFEWMREHAAGADVVDRSDDFALLALQGPRATAILARLTELDLDRVPRFHFAAGEVAGKRTIVAHTGYTGEDGWELYCAPAAAASLWEAILGAGRDDGILPAGLGARDTLRLEAALPLYGHELSEETTPFEARLGWVVRLDKGEFVGREALLRQRNEGLKRRLIGLELREPGVPRAGYAITLGGAPFGNVTSGTKSPSLGKGIALGYGGKAEIAPATVIGVEIRARTVAAEVVSLPFYRRPHEAPPRTGAAG